MNWYVIKSLIIVGDEGHIVELTVNAVDIFKAIDEATHAYSRICFNKYHDITRVQDDCGRFREGILEVINVMNDSTFDNSLSLSYWGTPVERMGICKS